MNGTGGAGVDNNYGVYLKDNGTVIRSTNGDIDFIGVGGNGTNSNVGVYIALKPTSRQLVAETSPSLEQGSSSGSNNYGFHQDGDARIQSTRALFCHWNR